MNRSRSWQYRCYNLLCRPFVKWQYALQQYNYMAHIRQSKPMFHCHQVIQILIFRLVPICFHKMTQANLHLYFIILIFFNYCHQSLQARNDYFFPSLKSLIVFSILFNIRFLFTIRKRVKKLLRFCIFIKRSF